MPNPSHQVRDQAARRREADAHLHHRVAEQRGDDPGEEKREPDRGSGDGSGLAQQGEDAGPDHGADAEEGGAADAHATGGRRRYRWDRRVVAEEEVNDRAAREQRDDPADLERNLEGVVDHALAQRGRARLVGLGGGDLGSVRGQEEHAGDGGPHRDHVAGADSERQPERDHRSRRRGLACGQGGDEEDRDRDRERPVLGEAAEGGDDRVLVVGDEGVRHPGDPEERDHRDHPRLEDRRGRDVAGLHVREEQDQSGCGEHEHLNQRRHRHRLDAAALCGDRRPQSLEDTEHADREDARQEDGDAALRVGHQHDLTGRCRRLDLAGGKAALVFDVVVQIFAVAVHEQRHHEDADDAGRDRDQQHVDDVVVVDLDERQHGRHRGRDRARGDPEGRGDGRAGECALRPDLVRVGELVDHRDQGEERVAGAREDRQQIRDVRREEVQRLRSCAQRITSDLHHVVDAARRLHRGGRRDHGNDDQHRADRRLAWIQPEQEDEHQGADATPEPEPDAAGAHAEGDEADHDGALERDQDPVGRAHLPLSSRSC